MCSLSQPSNHTVTAEMGHVEVLITKARFAQDNVNHVKRLWGDTHELVSVAEAMRDQARNDAYRAYVVMSAIVSARIASLA
jgi:hypothetical protein